LSELTFKIFRETNMSRCLRWHPRGFQEWSLSDWAVATAGELGEALNVIKKLNRERDGIVGNTLSIPELEASLADELADTAIYLDLLAASVGIDMAQAIAAKFNRTSEKNGFPERLPLPSPPEET
jgi:NTP pyrophosphatase (non-canonical NTP hydrolase)